MDNLNDADLSELKKLLLMSRSELSATAGADESGTVELDQTRFGRLSRMDAMQVQAMSGETARRRRIELERVVSALKRIDEDDYGYCAKCDESIPKGRLMVDPCAHMCIGCAEKSERKLGR